MLFDRIFKALLTGFACCAGVVLIFMTVSINFEVLMRYLLNRPTSWVVDSNSYALVFMTFLSAAWVLSREGHVKIELLVDRLPEKARRIINAATSIAGVILCGLFSWYGVVITHRAIVQKEMLVESIIVPKWPIVAVMPIGGFLLMIEFMRKGWRHTATSQSTDSHSS